MLNQTILQLFSTLQTSSVGDLDEIQLARRAARDPDAFAWIYERYLSGIYRYHLLRTGNVQDAQDLSAQTFLTALEAIGNFRGHGSLAAWLFGIASHKLADHHRRHQHDLPLDAGEQYSNQEQHPEDVTIQHLELERVVNALRVIAPERAEAIDLRIFGNLTTEEVAQAMNRSIPAVKMLISRGLSDLKERLAFLYEVQP